MHYVALRFDTEAADAEGWVDALLAAGALSVDVSDPRAGTPEETPLFGEPGELGTTVWPVSRLAVLFAPGADAIAALRHAAAAIGRAIPPHECYDVPEQDWVRATQAQFGPIAIGEGFWIVPSWCDPPDPAAINLRLDPGLAFGTGSHPTTRMCIEWLRAHVRPGTSVLDYGCGSGILAIAAARLGAEPVAGTDVDAQAIRASVDNARANGVRATFAMPDDLGAGTFDTVVANILANALTLLAPALAQRVGAGGQLALAGILEPQADSVAAAYERWFKLAAWRCVDGWVLLAGERGAGR